MARLPVTRGEWGELPSRLLPLSPKVKEDSSGRERIPPHCFLSFTGFIEPKLGLEERGTQALWEGGRVRGRGGEGDAGEGEKV